jgi:hypothetical protein
MAVVRFLVSAAILALPCAAAGQPWAEAVKAGDYRRASELLHPIVIEQHQNPSETNDPAVARQLADMYAQGLGVPRDPIVACALAQAFEKAVSMVPEVVNSIEDLHAYQAREKEWERFVRGHCDALSEYDKKVAGHVFGCLTFELPEPVLAVGAQTVWVAINGFSLREGGDQRFVVSLDCPLLVARLRSLTIDPPADAAPGVKPRQFVETLTWHYGGYRPGASSTFVLDSKFVLNWSMFELRGQKIEPVAPEHLYSVDRWPPVLPSDFDERFRLEMIRSGHVRWRLEGAPPKRGWIMLPERESR